MEHRLSIGPPSYEGGNPWFLCADEGQSFSARIVGTQVGKSGSRLKRGRIEYVIEVKTEFSTERRVVKQHEHFRSLLDRLEVMGEQGDLPDSDEDMLGMLYF